MPPMCLFYRYGTGNENNGISTNVNAKQAVTNLPVNTYPMVEQSSTGITARDSGQQEDHMLY